jgi:hypothetical protein
MATLFRPPTITKIEPRLPGRSVLDAEGSVWQNPIASQYPGKDKFFGLAGHPTYDWPVPKGAIPSISLKTWIDPLKLLAGQDKFFGLAGHPTYDWPVPKGKPHSIDLRTFTDSTKIKLIGKDTFFGLAGNPTKDWPVPKGAIPATTLKTWTDQFKLLLQGQDTFFGAAGQVPEFDWQNPRGKEHPISLRHWDVGNRLNTLFSFTAPFSLSDWPVPSRAVPPIELKTWIQRLNVLAGSDQFFGLAGHPSFDWPNPKGYVPSTGLKTWIQELLPTLLGQDQFFGLAGHPIFEWPNPRGNGPAIDLRTWIDKSKTQLIGQDLLPFAQDDWPVPKGPTPVITLRTLLQQLNILAGQDQFFGLGGAPQFNWPNPRGPISAQQWQSPSLLGVLLSSIQFPFNLSDWPVPKSATPASILRTWIQTLNLLAGQDKFFGLAGHPNFDWPVPKAAAYPSAIRGWLDQLKLNLRSQDRFFGLAGAPTFNWPNPRGPIPSIDLRTWLERYKLELIGQDQLPELNVQWPNPRGPVPAIDLRTWLERYKLELIGQDKLPQLNLSWPNPRGPAQPLQWTGQNLNETTLQAFLFPFAMLDWPVPPGDASAIILRTWLDTVKLNLIGKDTFFGGQGQPPANMNWPVPKGAASSVWYLPNPFNPNMPTPVSAEELLQIIRFAKIAWGGMGHWTR